MILETLITLFVNFLLGLLDLIQVIFLPYDALEVLSTFTIYGSYIVGSDLMLIFAAVIYAWTSAKLLVGVGIRIWELLPFM